MRDLISRRFGKDGEMGETVYKPMTPKLRNEITESIYCNIKELRTCEQNALVNAQLVGLNALQNIVNALPDGYLVPFKKTESRK